MTTIHDRGHLLTEQANPRTAALHTLSPAELVAVIQAEDRAITEALAVAAPAIAGFIAAVAPGFRRGGRLVYVGAGTSGRLGVLDASEAPPTFCVGHDRIIGLIAGGDGALRRSSEGAEDDPDGALPALRALALTSDDAVLGIAAGGTTPYARGALTGVKHAGSPPVTGLLTCAPVAAPPGCDHLIVVPTGPEVLTGSTRMKAGTATKQALNTISTSLMVLSGRVHGNLMIEVKATNAKLQDRAVRIVIALTGLNRPAALSVLESAGWSAKTAVVMHRLGHDRPTAEAALAAAGGRLDALLS
ncbi:N-acetylmuramic acid 6-phosphate etherase [Planctomycetota bacterium]|nr:N-acetylmuramic acid 6-phosphate etherase [Planctomycetota bacterium]